MTLNSVDPCRTSYNNMLAVALNFLYRTEPIYHASSQRNLTKVEAATTEYVEFKTTHDCISTPQQKWKLTDSDSISQR